MKDSYVDGKKMAKIGRKMVIYESRILRNSLYKKREIERHSDQKWLSKMDVNVFQFLLKKLGM